MEIRPDDPSIHGEKIREEYFEDTDKAVTNITDSTA